MQKAGGFHFLIAIITTVLIGMFMGYRLGPKEAVSQISPLAPCDIVLDDFNRPDGKIGPNWRGQKFKYRIKDQEAQVIWGGGPIYWRAGAFGPDQAACVTLAKICEHGHQSVLLKVQTNRRDHPKWWKGAIAVFYDPRESEIGIETYIPWLGWTTLATFPIEMKDGDQIGAHALADGTVEVYVNEVLIGTADSCPFFVDKGGFIGLWFTCIGHPRAVLDDFVTSSNLPTPTPTNTPVPPTPTATPTSNS